MQFEALVNSRRSIRGYKPDPVPRKLIEEIIEIAKGAPSSMNTQPWYLHVVTGEPLDRIRTGNTANMVAGIPPKRDFPMMERYEGIHRRRQIEVAVQLFEAMDITRDDKEGRTDWAMRGFRQFDAPVSIVLTYDKCLEPAAISQFDLGAISYGICLAAWERDKLSLIEVPRMANYKGGIWASWDADAPPEVKDILRRFCMRYAGPAGKAMFQMGGVFAEFEQSIIRERINVGLARARANGKKLGRPRVEREVEDAIRRELKSGTKGIRKIAGEMGVGVSVVQRVKVEQAALLT